MFVKMTSLYKGRFPVDLGGLTMNGFGKKETDDKTGALILKSNPGILVECDKDGKEIGVEQPVTEEVKDETLPTPDVDETQVEEDAAPVKPIVAAPAAKKQSASGLDVEIVRGKKDKR